MTLTWLVAAAVASAVPLVAADNRPPTRELKSLAFGKQPQRARTLFDTKRAPGQPLDAEWLEAMSWVARAGAIGEDWNLAAEYAERTLEGCEALLEGRPLGKDPDAPFPIALGAAIETMGKFFVAQGDRGQAVAYLRGHLEKFAGTAVETRLNKNLMLLDLAGKPMPDVATDQWLGEHRFDPADLRGNVTLFFFWAHWCEDCSAQKPSLRSLQRRFAGRGLRIVAPTRLYGYLERGHDVSQAAELEYIEKAHVANDELLRSIPVPLSAENFVSFGVSSTPTLVLVDRSGVVRLYHPGGIDGSDLASQVEDLL